MISIAYLLSVAFVQRLSYSKLDFLHYFFYIYLYDVTIGTFSFIVILHTSSYWHRKCDLQVNDLTIIAWRLPFPTNYLFPSSTCTCKAILIGITNATQESYFHLPFNYSNTVEAIKQVDYYRIVLLYILLILILKMAICHFWAV